MEDQVALFDFIKDAGHALFHGSPSAEHLTTELQRTGLDASGLRVSLDGDKVKLSGQALTQEQAERIILSIGNTIGIAQVDTAELKVQQPAPESKLYTVKKGDTLFKIAETQYGKGNGAKYSEIVKANTPPVKSPDLIQPGWVLRIPPLGA